MLVRCSVFGCALRGSPSGDNRPDQANGITAGSAPAGLVPSHQFGVPKSMTSLCGFGTQAGLFRPTFIANSAPVGLRITRVACGQFNHA